MHTQQTNRRRRDTHEKQQTQEDQRNHSGERKRAETKTTRTKTDGRKEGELKEETKLLMLVFKEVARKKFIEGAADAAD